MGQLFPALAAALAGLLVYVVLLGTLVTLFIKYLSTTLTFRQSLVIGVNAMLPMAGLMVIATLLRLSFAQSMGPTAESVAGVVGMFVAGSMITRLAERSGEKRTGKVGIGAKTMLSILLAAWLLAGIYALAV
jgi:hypothetical protein